MWPAHAAAPRAGDSSPALSGHGPWTSAAHYLAENARVGDVAIVEGGHSFTYADLRWAAGVLSQELYEAGVQPGARVGILGANSLFWAAAYLAALRGHVAVPFSDRLSPSEIAGQARRVGCEAVFIDRVAQRRFGDVFEGNAISITDGCLESGREASELPDLTRDLDADALLLFTSGTTSAAKAVRITHRNIIANTESIITYVGLRRSDRMLVVLPFYYCYGLSLLHTHLRVGGSVVLCNSFVFPEVAVDMLVRERCTGLAGVPSTFQMLLRASSIRSRELPDLRLIQQAGGKLPPAQIEELVALSSGARVFVMYGQTEATARLSYLPPELVLDRPGSIGRGIPGVELTVVAKDGAPVGVGEVGEIMARGANVSPGYFDDPEGTADKFPHGRLRTGDLATVDADGFIYIVDRRDDFIKTWGHRVSSQEIESTVLRMPDLVSAAAVGIEDQEAGEAVMLVVSVRPGAAIDAEDVSEFARAELAKHKVPKAVFVVNVIPLNANGKVDKNQVREMVARLAEAPDIEE